MLPDFPKPKAFIKKRQAEHFFNVHSKVMGPLHDAQQAHLREGHRFAIVRENGTFDEMKWKKVQVKAEIKREEIENLSEQEVFARFERMAVEMALQQKAIAFQEISQAVDTVGNTVSGGITPDTILKLYDKISLDFQDDGQHVPLAFSGSQEANIAFARALEKVHTDPELHRQFELLIQRKRHEWRERESARKLVD